MSYLETVLVAGLLVDTVLVPVGRDVDYDGH